MRFLSGLADTLLSPFDALACWFCSPLHALCRSNLLEVEHEVHAAREVEASNQGATFERSTLDCVMKCLKGFEQA